MAGIAFAFACQAQSTLTFKLSDLKSDTVKVVIFDKTMHGMEKEDRIVAKDGVFSYSCDADKARFAMFSVMTENGSRRMQAFFFPGENGMLKGTTEHATWSGGKFYSELAAADKLTEETEAKLNQVMKEYNEKIKAGENRDALEQTYSPLYDSLSGELADIQSKYIKNHPGSNVCPTFFVRMELEDVEKALSTLKPEVKAGPMSDIVTAFQMMVDKEKARKEASKTVADGCVAPDFTLNDIEGKPFSLSSLRGKYVVLDFWGSWCIWCIRGMPEMKNYYAKYAGKFEIVGVDCNDTDQKWKDAVKKNELPWKHVYCPKGSDLLAKYAIQGFPTKIVIDPEGKILKTVCGEDPDFYKFLDQTFTK